MGFCAQYLVFNTSELSQGVNLPILAHLQGTIIVNQLLDGLVFHPLYA